MAAPANIVESLNSARGIVLRDHALYPQVVPGVLQVIAPGASLELRRWGADFLAETFASQAATAEEKQNMSLLVLDTLQGYLNRKEDMGEDEDTSVVKSAVQCAASLYPFVFRHTVTNARDSETWSKIAKIKSSILRRMDTAAPGIRICCIKFVACVVQTQTPGLIADPRRPEHNEISLALVPRDHPIIPPANLEAEASGLLDRLLGVLQENISDPLVVTATLNSLATLVQRRPSIASKILTTVLAFNPLRLVNRPPSGKDKVSVRSMTRTTMSFLLNCLKRNPNTTFAGRIQQQVERLKHGLTEVFTENHQLKRPAPDEPIDGLDDTKRQRIETQTANGITSQQRPPTFAPLPPGPVTLAQLFTLTRDPNAINFHAERLPTQLVSQLIFALAAQVPQSHVDEAVSAVRARWLNAERQGVGSALDAAKDAIGEEDDDDYDPTLSLGGGTEQILNQLDHASPNGVIASIAVERYNLPPPPPLTEADRGEYSKVALTRVFGTLADLDKEARLKGKQSQPEQRLNRLTAVSVSGHDREGWLTLVTRLATRAPFDLQRDDGPIKREGDERSLKKKGNVLDLSSGIREALLNYIMENFRSRIDVAIMWLNEEWYSDRLIQKQKQEEGVEIDTAYLPNYWHWTLRLMDALMPYWDVKDGRILIRFLSEVPAIDRNVLDRVRKIAEDPERIQMTVTALLYLVTFRPPARELVIDCTEQMWRENSDARSGAKKILSKWRPAVLEDGTEVKAEV